jgi:trimethylamine--corrinoid protein Co-methyltransferase
MDSGLQGSLQLQVMANDTIGWLRAATAGVVVDDETLALDVVDELGPDGDYLSHQHTMRHFREPFYSKIADKGTHGQWLERGATSMEHRAARLVDKILESHEPEPLPADVRQSIKSIVQREQAWIDGKG